MKDFLNNSSWILNLVFLLLALGGIIATIIAYSKGRNKKIGAYYMRHFPIVSEDMTSIPGIKILMHQEQITNLALTYVAIWNNGNDIINSNDIAPKAPVEIKIKEKCKIFTYETDLIKNKINNITVVQNSENDKLCVNFDFLAPRDGVIVKVYHNGKNESDLYVLGNIKGFGDFKAMDIEEDKLFTSFLDLLFGRLKRIFHSIGKPTWLFVIIFILAFLTFPILLPLMFVDSIRKLIYILPKDYQYIKKTKANNIRKK